MKKELKKELSKKNKNKVNWSWIIKIVLLTFTISILFIDVVAIPNSTPIYCLPTSFKIL